MVIGRDIDMSTLGHSGGLACQQKVLLTFSGPGYSLTMVFLVYIQRYTNI